MSKIKKLNAMRKESGLTLLELLAIVVILGILASLAIPLYIAYEESALMQKTNFHYREAVKTVSRGYVEDRISLAYGTDPVKPQDTAGWIALFSQGNPLAPGGGPAFIDSEVGSSATGAIGVTMDEDVVTLVRPPYIELTEHRAIISGSDVTYIPPLES